ncbi:MAG: hypothetical protein LBM87_02490 [Ruminococcus sp.]|nr:hypothetical protein [Ruminococcus sp.]
MKIRRILAAVLAAAIITAISGCGQTEETGSGGDLTRETAGEAEGTTMAATTTAATTTEAPKPVINLPLVVTNNTLTEDYYIDISGNVKAYGNDESLMSDVKSIFVLKPDGFSENDTSYFFIKNDNSLWAFGDGKVIGDNTGISKATIDKAVKITDNVAEITGGQIYAQTTPTIFIIKRDKTLWGWGCNNSNQLGGVSDDSTVYEPVEIMNDVTEIDLLYSAIVAVKSTGEMWGWSIVGSSSMTMFSGATGIFYNENSTTSTPSILGESIRSFGQFGENSYYVVDVDDTLWTWKYESANYISAATGGSSTYGLPEEMINDVKSVFTNCEPLSIGYFDDNISVVKTDGTLWAMGANESGQLGDGSLIDRDEFVQITSGEEGFENIKTVKYKAAITEGGTYFFWTSDNPNPRWGGVLIYDRYNLNNDDYYDFLEIYGRYYNRTISDTLATNVMIPAEEIIE